MKKLFNTIGDALGVICVIVLTVAANYFAIMRVLQMDRMEWIVVGGSTGFVAFLFGVTHGLTVIKRWIGI